MDQETPLPSQTWDEDRLADASAKSKLLRGLFTNQVFVQPDGLHLRISLGELAGGEPLFHTAIVVPNSDALEFGQLLVRMAEAAIEQQSAALRQMFDSAGERTNGDQ